MKLQRKYVEKVWGRTGLPAPFAHGDGKRIGEIWFDAPGRVLPLLIKYLFTSEKLSVQVHPGDEAARAAGLPDGKEECWYILDAEPDACIGLGTVRPIAGEELRAAALSGEIETLLDWKPVKAGDFFYLRAGTVHAIGAGVSLIEVQQNADITYRLYDYGRPRELHLDAAMGVAEARPYADPRACKVDPGEDRALVDGPKFALRLCDGDLAGVDRDKPLFLIPLTGSVTVAGEQGGVGDCLLAEPGEDIDASPAARLLVAWSLEDAA